MKRNIFTILLAFVLCFTGLAGSVPYQAHAAGLREVESNDNKKDATLVPLNQVMKGALSAETDVDYYKFNLTDRGVFQIDFGIDASENANAAKEGWKLEVRDIDNNLIKEYGKIKSAFSLPKFSFEAGSYYIKVVAQDNYSDYYARLILIIVSKFILKKI